MSDLQTPRGSSVDGSTTAISASGHTPHVLVACADPNALRECEGHLLNAGVRVLAARTGFEAIVKASCHMPDLIVLDESLGPDEVAETARLLTCCPVTAFTPVICLRKRRRVPMRVLTTLRRRSLA